MLCETNKKNDKTLICNVKKPSRLAYSPCFLKAKLQFSVLYKLSFHYKNN